MARLFLLISVFTLSSCAIFGEYRHRHTHTTSLVQFLYPQGKLPLEDKRNPILNLPLRVGLAFIPDRSSKQVISPVLKNTLLENVKASFGSKGYVNEIVVIPEMYLQTSQGFGTLEQIKNLYQLDVIALVSYDQMVNAKDNLLSLSYLTIVGAYIFPGTGYQVNTMIDMAVIDVDSRSILFRAAGTSSSKNQIVAEGYRSQAYRKRQNAEFELAMGQMQGNLIVELTKFEQRLGEKDPNDRIKVKHRKGYTGGSVSLFLLCLLFCMALFKFKYEFRNN
ncbi:MAG: rhombotarget lipoprotein [Alcanivoracaceae bacterium]|nr:rhombotarget lipoprotein [Alcanivoracaceae bacterium]